jgi:hypothetical protein
MTEPESTSPGETDSANELKRALKAFKKRLKVTRLDYESKLGYGPMTKGGKSGLVGIEPPREFSPEVWQELARQNKLKHIGQGLYELVEGA